jgi:hypothetical protein
MRSKLEEAAVRVASSMNAQNVANSLWAFATLGWQAWEGGASDALVGGALEEAAVRVSTSMNPQAVANTLWALAKLGWLARETALSDALEVAAVRVASIMNAQNVANSLWALATLEWQAGEGGMYGALEGAAVRVSTNMKAQEVANTLWALATLGWHAGKDCAPMHGALEGAAVRVSASMNAQDVANTLWALATLGWQAGEAAMHGALEAAAVRVASTMKAQEVANTLWALATLGWHAGGGSIRSALEGAVVLVASSMSVQDVANVLWALAVLGWKASTEMAQCFERLVDRFVSADGQVVRLAARDLSQLLQAHLASQFLGLGLVMLPPPCLEVALEAYREKARNVTTSTAQREVADSLGRLGTAHQLEYATADGLFSIDIAIVDRRIALEFDGPSHFTTNTLQPLGHTLLRNRLLSAMGWKVVSIPFFEWNGLRQAERDAYVQRRVDPSSSCHGPLT